MLSDGVCQSWELYREVMGGGGIAQGSCLSTVWSVHEMECSHNTGSCVKGNQTHTEWSYSMNIRKAGGKWVSWQIYVINLEI